MPAWLDTSLVVAAVLAAAGSLWRRHRRRGQTGCVACPAADGQAGGQKAVHTGAGPARRTP